MYYFPVMALENKGWFCQFAKSKTNICFYHWFAIHCVYNCTLCTSFIISNYSFSM